MRLARGVTSVASALALAVTLTGCAIIPVGGNPASYRDVVKGDPLRKPYVRVIATPPRPEWSPRQVVVGFLAAMASVDDPGYAVARQYLMPGAAHAWRPEVGVTVYDKGTIPEQPVPADDVTEVNVTLKGTVTGVIDGEGRYSAEATPGGRQLSQTFTLVRQPQGWRITEVPDGLLLSEDDVRRSYRAVKLYYLDHHRKGLVVDEVRIPVNPSSDFAESILKRLLAGPTAGLRDAVSNALPAGTELLDISTEDDKIIVDLNHAATNAISAEEGGDAVEAMAAQIGWTLDQLTERWDIEVRVHGEPYYSTGGTLDISYERYGRFDPWLNPERTTGYVVQGGALHSLNSEGDPEAVPGVAGQPGGAGTALAISGAPQPKVATLGKGGRAVMVTQLVQNGQWQEWISGTNLTRPSWDRHDAVWTVDRLGPRSSRVLRHDGRRQTRIPAPWLEGVGVRDLRVARDGVRVAAVVEDELGVHVWVGLVVVKGGQIRLAHPRTLATAAEGEQILGIAWRDATTLLVLASGKAGREIRSISVTDGIAESFKADACITSITALGDRVLAGARCADDNEPEVLSWDPAKQAWAPLLSTPATTPRLPLD